MAWRAPRPLGSGAEIWWASELAPSPSKAIGVPSPGVLLMRNSTAASPMLMPLRFTENGLQRSFDTASSAEKPLRVSLHRLSTPPHSTASHRPRSSRRRALIKARALEVQAVEIT
ncbi:hypothetical protein D3C78_1394810 [compost metagenome]